MRDYLIKPSNVIVVVVVMVALTISNVVLATSLTKLRRANTPSASGLAEGVTVPMIAGTKASTKQTWRVLPAGTSAMFLLVYREQCHYCEQNWPAWETVFGGAHAKIPAVVVTDDSALRPEYESKHPLLAQRLALYGVDPNQVGSLNLNLTPQTILIRDGKVERDWVGALNADQIAQVEKSIASLQ